MLISIVFLVLVLDLVISLSFDSVSVNLVRLSEPVGQLSVTDFFVVFKFRFARVLFSLNSIWFSAFCVHLFFVFSFRSVNCAI